MNEAFSVDAQIIISNEKGSQKHEAAVRVIGKVTRKKVLEACRKIYAKGDLAVKLESFIVRGEADAPIVKSRRSLNRGSR